MRSLNNFFFSSVFLFALAGCNGCSVGGNGGTVNNVPIGETGVATLNWIPPATDVNGRPLTGLAGFKIYYGTASQTYYSQAVDVGNVTSYTLHNLQTGVVLYFAVTAYDFSGSESAFSNEVSTSL